MQLLSVSAPAHPKFEWIITIGLPTHHAAELPIVDLGANSIRLVSGSNVTNLPFPDECIPVDVATAQCKLRKRQQQLIVSWVGQEASCQGGEGTEDSDLSFQQYIFSKALQPDDFEPRPRVVEGWLPRSSSNALKSKVGAGTERVSQQEFCNIGSKVGLEPNKKWLRHCKLRRMRGEEPLSEKEWSRQSKLRPQMIDLPGRGLWSITNLEEAFEAKASCHDVVPERVAEVVAVAPGTLTEGAKKCCAMTDVTAWAKASLMEDLVFACSTDRQHNDGEHLRIDAIVTHSKIKDGHAFIALSEKQVQYGYSFMCDVEFCANVAERRNLSEAPTQIRVLGVVKISRLESGLNSSGLLEVMKCELQDQALLKRHQVALQPVILRLKRSIAYFLDCFQRRLSSLGTTKCVEQHISQMNRLYQDSSEVHHASELRYEHLLTSSSEQAFALCNLGKVRMDFKDFGAARTLLQKCLELQPELPEAWLNWAILQDNLGNWDQASRAAERAAALRPKWVSAVAHAAWYHLKRGDISMASTRVQDGLALGEPNAWLEKTLAKLAQQRHQRDEALKHYNNCLRLDPQQYDVRQWISILSGSTPSSLQPRYVEGLFDDFAEHFDSTLQRTLDYQTPERLCIMIKSVLHSLGSHWPTCRTWRVLDLGCGTGLSGVPLRDVAATLVGIDLSSVMLRKAEVRTIYDELRRGEIVEHLENAMAAGEMYDLVVAADVFCYLGDLCEVLREVRKILATSVCGKPLVAFSVEASDGRAKCYTLNESTGRYQHTEEYVKQSLGSAGFEFIRHETSFLRLEQGHPVEGFLFAATPLA